MMRSACTLPFLSLLMLSACADGTGVAPSEAARLPPVPQALRPYEPPAAGFPDPLLGDESQRFDIRHAIVAPTRFEGETRPCWLTHPGRVVPIPSDLRHHYPDAVTHRAAVQCGTEDLESWADLVLDAQAAEPYAEITPGVTIRVQLYPGRRGFRGYPVLGFAGVDDSEEAVTAPLAMLTPVPTGYDFSEADSLSDSDRVQTCAVWSVGTLEPIDSTIRARLGYAAEATTRMTLKCHSVTRETYVDVMLDHTRARAALAIRRGHRIAVRVLDPAGGMAEFPLVSLEDLLDVEPPPPPEPPADPESPSPLPADSPSSPPAPPSEADAPSSAT